jgi:hypothetical protein
MPKPFRPNLTDDKGATKEVRLMYFLRGAIETFTEQTPCTPAEVTWALAFMTGSAIGQPRMLEAVGDLSPKRLRDYAVAVLDDGIDSAQAAERKIIMPN